MVLPLFCNGIVVGGRLDSGCSASGWSSGDDGMPVAAQRDAGCEKSGLYVE